MNGCQMCEEEFDDEIRECYTRCGHHFCLDCIKEWLDHILRPGCPVCDTPMLKGSIHVPNSRQLVLRGRVVNFSQSHR